MAQIRYRIPEGMLPFVCTWTRTSYDASVHDPAQFRTFLDQAFLQHPELFPAAFANGYVLKDTQAIPQVGTVPTPHYLSDHRPRLFPFAPTL